VFFAKIHLAHEQHGTSSRTLAPQIV